MVNWFDKGTDELATITHCVTLYNSLSMKDGVAMTSKIQLCCCLLQICDQETLGYVYCGSLNQHVYFYFKQTGSLGISGDLIQL